MLIRLWLKRRTKRRRRMDITQGLCLYLLVGTGEGYKGSTRCRFKKKSRRKFHNIFIRFVLKEEKTTRMNTMIEWWL